MKPTGCHDKGTAVAFLWACACWARRLHIWSRQHLATLYIQKVLSQSSLSLGCGCCQACNPPPHTHTHTPHLRIPSPATSCCSWTLARLLWPASNQKQPHLADSTRSYDIMRQQQTFWDPVERSVIWGGSQNSTENVKQEEIWLKEGGTIKDMKLSITLHFIALVITLILFPHGLHWIWSRIDAVWPSLYP